MIWDADISFEGFQKRIESWYEGKAFELCDPPINAQFALDLMSKAKSPTMTTAKSLGSTPPRLN